MFMFLDLVETPPWPPTPTSCLVCSVKGLVDVSARAYTMSSFWPLAIGGVLAVTGIGAAVYAKHTASAAGGLPK
jgi:hypothetical protein